MNESQFILNVIFHNDFNNVEKMCFKNNKRLISVIELIPIGTILVCFSD